MRKALIISAVAATAAMALGAPATAFAADAAPTPSASPTAAPSPSASPADQGSNTITLNNSTARPGDKVNITLNGPHLKDVKVSSSILTHPFVFQGIYGGGTVKADAKAGAYQVTMSGKNESGKEVSASATLTVTTQTPADSGTLKMSPGEGAAGAKVDVSLKITNGAQPQAVTVKSAAFDGPVSLARGKDGLWVGAAKVAEVKDGSYGVAAVSDIPGTKAFATGTFTVGKVTPPTPQPTPRPADQHVVPKGSVNTGMAPVASSSPTADIVAGGTVAAGAAALLAVALHKRNRSKGF
ncbi:hypothetical protein ACIQWR_37735 [Streptomyces sp. NPDC098789]|uniref:hypothetical protein n=1 Tax=Streptomyces sp. NPDC098789 TaxID=3366098 RepID=UPI00380C216E